MANHALYGQIQYNIHNIKNQGSINKGSIFPNSQSSHIWDDLATMLDPCWIKKVTPRLRPLDNNRVTPIPVFPGAHSSGSEQETNMLTKIWPFQTISGKILGGYTNFWINRKIIHFSREKDINFRKLMSC